MNSYRFARMGQIIAIVGADAEFSNNVMTGARAIAKQERLTLSTITPGATDYSPIVRAIEATNPDLIFVASYPLDSVGIVRAATELGLKTQMFGGGMVGLQYATFLQQLANKLNRVVNYHLYVPSPTMSFPGIDDFLKVYQARAPEQGNRPAWVLSAAIRLRSHANPRAGHQSDRHAKR